MARDLHTRIVADGLVTIGTFSLLTGLSITTLRHYDDVGLLVPADVDSRTGFRRYRIQQVDRASRIRMLRSVELSPDDIAAVLDSDDSSARLVMQRHRDSLAERRTQIERLIRQLDTYIEKGLELISDKRIAREMEGTLESTSFPGLGERHLGKVRDSYVRDGVRTIVTTDRVSAFDRQLGTIPFKGQALNAVANYWFEATSDIIPNHLLEVPDPNVVRVRECAPVALEFVVRGYITGVTPTSLWFNYEEGRREVAGNALPDGLRKNERLPSPILTPTTKFEEHDRNLSRGEAIEEGLVGGDLFDRAAAASFELFDRGTQLAAERGLILVDTKYEFGVVDEELVLMDEIHTADSSRYWYADTYEELLRKGKEQRALDKEPLREWLVERGFRGEGPPPPLTDDVRVATAMRYISLAEELTEQPFAVTDETARERVTQLLGAP